MIPAERDAALKAFIAGKAKVLIGTNAVSRGLDIDTVTHVINYDIPVDKDGPSKAHYTHRVGRTGRVNRTGIAVNLVYDNESRNALDKIKANLNITIDPLPIDDPDEAERIFKKALKEKKAAKKEAAAEPSS